MVGVKILPARVFLKLAAVELACEVGAYVVAGPFGKRHVVADLGDDLVGDRRSGRPVSAVQPRRARTQARGRRRRVVPQRFFPNGCRLPAIPEPPVWRVQHLPAATSSNPCPLQAASSTLPGAPRRDTGYRAALPSVAPRSSTPRRSPAGALVGWRPPIAFKA